MVDDLTRADFEGRKRIAGLVEHLHARMPGFRGCYVIDVAPQLGIRQARLLEGLYVVTKEDVTECRHFADLVARSRDYYTFIRPTVDTRDKNSWKATVTRMDRRALMKLTGASMATLATASLFKISNAKAQTMSNQWDKTFPRSEKVDHQKITFKNRYGLTLAADLYLPRTEPTGSWPRLPSAVRSAR